MLSSSSFNLSASAFLSSAAFSTVLIPNIFIAFEAVSDFEPKDDWLDFGLRVPNAGGFSAFNFELDLSGLGLVALLSA